MDNYSALTNNYLPGRPQFMTVRIYILAPMLLLVLSCSKKVETRILDKYPNTGVFVQDCVTWNGKEDVDWTRSRLGRLYSRTSKEVVVDAMKLGQECIVDVGKSLKDNQSLTKESTCAKLESILAAHQYLEERSAIKVKPTPQKIITYAEAYASTFAFVEDLREPWKQLPPEHRLNIFINKCDSTLRDGKKGDTDFEKASNFAAQCVQGITNHEVDLSGCSAAEKILKKYNYLGQGTTSPALPNKKETEEAEYFARLNKLSTSGKTEDEISAIFFNEALPLSELTGKGVEEIKRLVFIEKVHCRLPATVYINASHWNTLDCSQKISAVNLLGKFCGKLTFFVNSQDFQKGFGTWSPEHDAAVFGRDNCGTIH